MDDKAVGLAERMGHRFQRDFGIDALSIAIALCTLHVALSSAILIYTTWMTLDQSMYVEQFVGNFALLSYSTMYGSAAFFAACLAVFFSHESKKIRRNAIAGHLNHLRREYLLHRMLMAVTLMLSLIWCLTIATFVVSLPGLVPALALPLTVLLLYIAMCFGAATPLPPGPSKFGTWIASVRTSFFRPQAVPAG